MVSGTNKYMVHPVFSLLQSAERLVVLTFLLGKLVVLTN